MNGRFCYNAESVILMSVVRNKTLITVFTYLILIIRLYPFIIFHFLLFQSKG